MVMEDNLSADTQVQPARLWATRLLIAVLVLAVLAGIAYGIKKLFSGGPAQKKQITTVKLLPDTPPPPPPPPPKEPPKETPKEQPKEAPKAPEPKPVEAPPAETLKMEGAAGDGPSPFQAGAVNNEYKGGEVSTKIGGKKNMAAFAWFTNKVDAQIKKALDAEAELSKVKYQVDVRVFLNAQGDIDHAELIDSSGNPETDALIRKVLSRIPPLKESAPEDMPRKVIVRMTSKNMS
jgi:periplasmic protein TonB